MKKLIAVLFLLCVGVVYSEDRGYLGASSASTVLLERPGAGNQNCLTNLTWSGSNFPAAGFNVSVIDGSTTSGTTIYTLPLSTGPFRQTWPHESPLCATHNSSMTIVGSHEIRLNYTGYIRGNR